MSASQTFSLRGVSRFKIATRGIGFSDIQAAIEEGRIVDIIPHPNQKRYANQNVLIVELDSYIYLVPFVEDDDKIFLKTIYPSRKFTRKYLS